MKGRSCGNKVVILRHGESEPRLAGIVVVCEALLKEDLGFDGEEFGSQDVSIDMDAAKFRERGERSIVPALHQKVARRLREGQHSQSQN